MAYFKETKSDGTVTGVLEIPSALKEVELEDGSKELKELQAVPESTDNYSYEEITEEEYNTLKTSMTQSTIPTGPTQEERLSALESAFLVLMGG